MKTRKVLAFILFCFIFITVVFVVVDTKHFHGINNAFKRNPAAIRKGFDFSNLKGDVLASHSKKRLLQGAELIETTGEVGVRLGHFLVSGPDGKSIFVCNKYERIKMRFESEGFAVDGEAASMVVETNCQITQDLAQISPVWIPYRKILAEKPGDFEITYRDSTPRIFNFKNIIDEWPREWVLVEISLFNDGGENLIVDRQQIRQVISRPIRLSWR